jgi:hypothetical protein
MVATLVTLCAFDRQHIQWFFHDTQHPLITVFSGAYLALRQTRISDIKAGLAVCSVRFQIPQG